MTRWRHRPVVERPAGGGRPVVGAAVEHADVSVAAGGEEAGAGHGPLAVAAHHGERPVGNVGAWRWRRARRGAAPGTWPASYSLAWRTSTTRPVMAAGSTRRWWRSARPLARQASMPPVELADEVLVADVEALADQLVAVLVVVEDEHERPVRVDEPAEPAGERRAQACWPSSRGGARRRTRRPGGRRRPHRPPARWRSTSSALSRSRRGRAVVAAGSEPVQLGKPGEVGGEGAEPGEEPRRRTRPRR